MRGKFYLIFTADNWLKDEYNPAGRWGTAGYAFVRVAEAIAGPYIPISYIPGAACDTSLFEAADGKTIYAVIPRGDIEIQEIDLTGLPRGEVKLLGKPRKIVTAGNGASGSRPDRSTSRVPGWCATAASMSSSMPRSTRTCGFPSSSATGPELPGPATLSAPGKRTLAARSSSAAISRSSTAPAGVRGSPIRRG